MSRRLDWIVGITLSAAAAAAGASGADGEWLEVPASGFAAVARDLAPGAQVRLSGLHDPDAARSETFVGRRFEIFAPDARLVARDANAERDLARPHDARFRGAFEGVAGSRVLISVLADGTLRGIAADWTGFSLILPGADGAPQVRRVDAARRPARPFRCDQAELAGAAVPPVDFDAALRAAPPAGTFAGLAPAPSYTARVAIDSDFEFYNLFGDTIDAVEYVADLMAFMSILYEEEVDTSMQVSYLRLWTTAVDPWNQSSSICNLFDFGKYWNDNMTGQSRTIAHMMSGKNSGGGVAWRGVLCNGPFNYDTGPAPNLWTPG